MPRRVFLRLFFGLPSDRSSGQISVLAPGADLNSAGGVEVQSNALAGKCRIVRPYDAAAPRIARSITYNRRFAIIFCIVFLHLFEHELSRNSRQVSEIL